VERVTRAWAVGLCGAVDGRRQSLTAGRAREEAGRAALQLGRAREARRGSSEVGARLYRCGSEPQTSMATWRGHRRTT
jgi:hypothetical protein